MPILFHTRHEAFAVAHAQGACRVDAYRAAGYKGGPKNAPKIAKLPRVAARVAELRGQWGDSVDLAPVIDAMVRLALTADVSTAGGRPQRRQGPAGGGRQVEDETGRAEVSAIRRRAAGNERRGVVQDLCAAGERAAGAGLRFSWCGPAPPAAFS